MTIDMPGEERSGEGLNRMTSRWGRSGSLNHITSDMLGGKGHPGNEIPPYNCLLLGTLGLLLWMTFCAWLGSCLTADHSNIRGT